MSAHDEFLAIVNPAAGGGRCGKLARSVLDRLQTEGIRLTSVRTEGPGHAVEIARAAYEQGYRRFLAVGGDGTSFEIVNGLFGLSLASDESVSPACAVRADRPERSEASAPLVGSLPGHERPILGFLPLGTGNSFLRDFSPRGLDHAVEAIRVGRTRRCDVLRLTHAEGVVHFINLLSMGFPADVAAVTNRRFKPLGEIGYLLGVFVCLARLSRRRFPLRLDGHEPEDLDRCLFLSFNNSKFTGGKMMIAPQADVADGLIEVVRWGPIGRIGLLRNLPGLYDGTHIEHPLAKRRAVRTVEFELDEPVTVMVDGEVMTLRCQRLDVLPSSLDVMV
jgi:diacylglycerol kinase (ATP)